MARGDRVPRPARKDEYELKFATRQAQVGWQALRATVPNALVDAWEFLTASPLTVAPNNYPLRDALGTVTRAGVAHQRWQHKPTLRGDGRIWFFVVDTTVYIEAVHTRHPNETKR